LFIKHDAIQQQHPDRVESLRGMLCTTIRSNKMPTQRGIEDPPQYMPWLCYTLGYRLRLQNEAANMPGGRNFKTFFYPFNRGFYTILEDKADNDILSALTSRWAESFPSSSSASAKQKKAALATTKLSKRSANPSSSVHNLPGSDPGYVSNPIKDTWQSILDGMNPIEINGVKIYNPVFLTVDENRNFKDVAPSQVGYDSLGYPIIKNALSSLTTTASLASGGTSTTLPKIPSCYVVKGDIVLFGVVPAEITTINDGNGVYEIVKLKAPSIDIAILIPDLAQLTGIWLKDMTLTYQSKYRGSVSPGLRLDFTLIPTGPLKPVATALKDVFGQDNPGLSLSGLISLNRDWDVAPKPIAFSLRAALLQMNLKLAHVVTITELGVDIHVDRGIGDDSSGMRNYNFGLGFSGAAAVAIPGSCVPMLVRWELSKLDTTYWLSLQMSDEEWTDVLGVMGLNVSGDQRCRPAIVELINIWPLVVQGPVLNRLLNC
jgi:hypothetical protein